jgi:hypothetical protein
VPNARLRPNLNKVQKFLKPGKRNPLVPDKRPVVFNAEADAGQKNSLMKRLLGSILGALALIALGLLQSTKKSLSKRADPLKGKFRSFLLASLRNFLADEADRARSLKRGGNLEFVVLDAEDAENRYRVEPADHLTAEKIFDARWAMTLLTRAVDRLPEQYATTRDVLDGIGGQRDCSYLRPGR